MVSREFLLCDDSKIEREGVKTGLEAAWKKLFRETLVVEECVDIVAKGKGGHLRIDISEVGQYECVILDVYWGDSDPRGIGIARKLRLRFPELKIFIISQRVGVEDFQKLLPIGIEGYLAKNNQEPKSWALEIHRSLFETRTGGVLLRELRGLCRKTTSWCNKEVDQAASAVWLYESPYDQWTHFWNAWADSVAHMRLDLAVDKIKDFFADEELLTLALMPAMRGHLEHVLQVYFLGYVISHKCDRFAQAVDETIPRLLGKRYDPSKVDAYRDLFQFAWLASATLHDAAYALEVLPAFPGEADRIVGMFKFAKFNKTIPSLDAHRLEFSKKDVEDLDEVLKNLYGVDKGGKRLLKLAVFEDENGTKRHNHGVASALLMLSEFRDWSGLPDTPAELGAFLNWACVSVGLHALQRADTSWLGKVSLAKDPLSMLLAVCDEIQVWDRDRPDAGEGNSVFRGTKLRQFQVNGSGISASIDFIPFRGVCPGKQQKKDAIKKMNHSINNKMKNLSGFLDCHPLSFKIENRITEWGRVLPGLTL